MRGSQATCGIIWYLWKLGDQLIGEGQQLFHFVGRPANSQERWILVFGVIDYNRSKLGGLCLDARQLGLDFNHDISDDKVLWAHHGEDSAIRDPEACFDERHKLLHVCVMSTTSYQVSPFLQMPTTAAAYLESFLKLANKLTADAILFGGTAT